MASRDPSNPDIPPEPETSPSLPPIPPPLPKRPSGKPSRPPPPLPARARTSHPPPPERSESPDRSVQPEARSLLEDEKTSLDKLLALTDEGWDIDEQVRTLQIASGEPPSKLMRAVPPAEMVLPSAQELAPAPPKKSSVPPPLPGAKKSVPPPLPAEALEPMAEEPAEAKDKRAKPGAKKALPPLPPPKKPPPPPVAKGKLPPPPKKPPPPPVQSSSQRAHLEAPPPPRERARSLLDPLSAESLLELLTARLETLEAAGDTVGLSRAHVEMAIALESIVGDDPAAASHAELALSVDPKFAAAHSLLRRRKYGRANVTAMLEHLGHELAAATDDATRVELLAERARLLAASDKASAAREAWERALALAPHHAAALRGLEMELQSRAAADGSDAAWEALSAHLARMADAYASDERLAAWLHVERAQILEHRLHKVDAARAALERALELDGRVGPVRDASARFVSAHDDPSALAVLLEEEALLDKNAARAARLELDAACIVAHRLGEVPRAILLLERAAARAPTEDAVDRRVLHELLRLYEAAADTAAILRVRRARLRFIGDPAVVAQEHRALAVLCEKAGDVDGAIGHVQTALAAATDDATLHEHLDRLLAAAGRHEQRMAIWVTEAARNAEAPKRARALVRAAHIAEELGRRGDAVRHLRAAWIANPGDSEVLDALSRLLSAPPADKVDGDTRALLELYVQAAERARDPARRVAYLEKAALLWEEVLCDPSRALKLFQEILAIEPQRRGAVLGVARCAARLGDDATLAVALIEEANQAEDGADVLALKARAASAMAKRDPARALALVDDVLAQDHDHAAARALETRLHEEAGRWDRAAASLRARIDAAAHRNTPKSEMVALWLALAEIQRDRLRSPDAALASLQAARTADPAHPVPPDEIARLLESTGDPKGLRDALLGLAESAPTPEERSYHLVRAAELEELALRDDAKACATYAKALAAYPDDELAADRLARVLSRRASREGQHSSGAKALLGELVVHTLKRMDQAPSPEAARARAFAAASLLMAVGQDLGRATSLLESVVAEDPTHVAGLRSLEEIARSSGDTAALAKVLSREGDALRDVRGRLGALWSLAALEEWKLPASDASPTYARILALDPTDPGALEAMLRKDLPHARRGDVRARASMVATLRSLVALGSDETTRLGYELRLALGLEGASEGAGPDGPGLLREALDRYRAALRTDRLSLTAATGLARLAARLHDADGALAAALSLADIAAQPIVRSRYLLEAADLLLTADDERLGPMSERRTRAGGLLEKALEADPDSIAAAGRLSTVWSEEGHSERLVDTFRTALKRASSPDAIVMLGSEIARVARDELKDLPTAIEAMQRVRAAAPQHIPSLLTLSELCIAQRAWAEAVDALESVVATSREVGPKLTALFALASVYDRVLDRKDDAERALRSALSIEPLNPRALRALLRHLAQQPKRDSTAEQAQLLEQLADVEREPAQKCELLVELAAMRSRLGENGAAERALVAAVAHSPGNAKVFARLASCFKTPQGATDDAAYARALGQVIAIGQRLGRVDASWFATLGQLEVERLARLREGVAHLLQAVTIDPDLHETRFELASAYAKAQAPQDAARTVHAMLSPDPHPLLSLADPAAALGLLEQSLGVERRAEEALAVSELRAVAGDLDDGRYAWLRGRRPRPLESGQPTLDRATLVTHVLPPEGRHVLLEVAAAIFGVEARVLRSDLGELGISSRDRVSPRSGHPTRHLMDRLMRMLGIDDVELVITPNVPRARVLTQDTPWLVVPSALSDLPEMAQLAAMGRALARIAFGVPWLEELPPPHIEALLIAAARHAVPGYARDSSPMTEQLVATYEGPVAKALGRRQRKLLEELAGHIAAPQGAPMPVMTFVSCLTRGELRTAYVLTGDLLATIDDVRGADAALLHATEQPGRGALTAVLEHPYAGDVARFAVTPEAAALKRRMGTSWA